MASHQLMESQPRLQRHISKKKKKRSKKKSTRSRRERERERYLGMYKGWATAISWNVRCAQEFACAKPPNISAHSPFAFANAREQSRENEEKLENEVDPVNSDPLLFFLYTFPPPKTSARSSSRSMFIFVFPLFALMLWILYCTTEKELCFFLLLLFFFYTREILISCKKMIQSCVELV